MKLINDNDEEKKEVEGKIEEREEKKKDEEEIQMEEHEVSFAGRFMDSAVVCQ